MRLIDADKINPNDVIGGNSEFATDIKMAMQDLIDCQPTAYDVDKVVEQLEERLCSETNAAVDVFCSRRNDHFIEAIGIVKEGGNIFDNSDQPERIKMYKVKDIVDILINHQKIGLDGYCGFKTNGDGNLVITLKDHVPGWRNRDGYGEAVEEVELLENEGEY